MADQSAGEPQEFRCEEDGCGYLVPVPEEPITELPCPGCGQSFFKSEVPLVLRVKDGQVHFSAPKKE